MTCKPGDIVRVRFLDHTHSHVTVGLLEFEAFGRVEAIDDTCLTIRSWDFVDGIKAQHADGDDIDRYNIVRSAITELRQLTEQ